MLVVTPARIQRLIGHATHAIETRHIVQEHLEEWSDRAGHAVLVGDAVHVLNVSLCENILRRCKR